MTDEEQTEIFEWRLMCKECTSIRFIKTGENLYECAECGHPHAFRELSRIMLVEE